MDPITLSDELADQLQKVIILHDERANDGGVAIQYHAAIIGYMLARQNFSMEQKREFLVQISDFIGHVFEDCQSSQAQDQEPAMGKWSPGDP